MDNEYKICPLLKDNCKRDKCAWWNGNQCSVRKGNDTEPETFMGL